MGQIQQNNLTFLRFYLAFAVLVRHIIVLADVDQLQALKPFFHTFFPSITTFFCISGFLTARSFISSKSLKMFFEKRALRLLPSYLLMILFCVILLSFLSTYSFKEYFSHPQLYKYLAANLTFMNFIQPCLPGVFIEENMVTCAVNGSLWTLKIEVMFYLLLPVLIFFTQKTKRKYLFFGAIYILSILYRNCLNYWGDISGNDTYYMLSRQLPGFLSYFICGVALNYYFDLFIKYKNILFFVGIGLFIIDKSIPFEFFKPLGLAMIVFSFAYSVKFLNSFGKYGDFSYGIYIYHFPLINIATYLGFFERYNPFIVASAIVLIVLSVGFLSWNLVEKHFLAMVRSPKMKLK